MIYPHSEGPGYAIAINAQMAKPLNGLPSVAQGLEFSGGFYIGEKSFSDLAQIAAECEAFISSLRDKYATEPPRTNERHSR
jgi:hypothetical protein